MRPIVVISSHTGFEIRFARLNAQPGGFVTAPNIMSARPKLAHGQPSLSAHGVALRHHQAATDHVELRTWQHLAAHLAACFIASGLLMSNV
jgi:hypothetical protein